MMTTALKSTFSCLLATFVLAGLCAADERQSGTQYVITLRPEAVVATGEVRLSDIATITGPNRVHCARLGEIDIEDAPAADKTLPVSSLQVEFRLRLAGVSLRACRIDGLRSLVRTASVVPVTHREIVAAPRVLGAEHVRDATRIPLPQRTSPPAPVSSASARSDEINRLRNALLAQIRQLEGKESQEATGYIQQAGAQSEDGAVITAAGTAKPQTPSERLTSVARNAILERLPWDPDDVEISVTHVGIKTTTEHLAEEGSLFPEIRSAWPPLGRVQIVVRASDGGESADIPVVLNVRHFQNVVLCARRIERGLAVTKDDVYIDRQEVRDMSAVQTSTDAVVGKLAVRTILPLQLIRPTDVRSHLPGTTNLPVIKRGATVNLMVTGGALAVSVRAEAMQDGRIGDVIRVKNLDSQKIRTGKVVSANKVEAQL